MLTLRPERPRARVPARRPRRIGGQPRPAFLVCSNLDPRGGAVKVAGQHVELKRRLLSASPLALRTWLEGHEPARERDAAHHYSGELDWTTISPTIDWAGGGLVTTAPDVARFVRAVWSERIVDSRGLEELKRWTPGASFPPGHALRYERYGLGMGGNVVEGVALLGHTGFIGAFAFHAPEVRRGSRRHPQRLAGRSLAARSRALPRAARGGLILQRRS